MAGAPRGSRLCPAKKPETVRKQKWQTQGCWVRLLLDCHISKATIQALRKRLYNLDTQHLAAWRSSAFLRASDEEILAACHRERRVFVTFDQRTIPDLLRSWAAEQRPHSGIIFGDENSVRPNHP